MKSFCLRFLFLTGLRDYASDAGCFCCFLAAHTCLRVDCPCHLLTIRRETVLVFQHNRLVIHSSGGGIANTKRARKGRVRYTWNANTSDWTGGVLFFFTVMVL